MRSALYYPYTSIQSERLIRTSLLLWDKVHIIVPYEGFGFRPNDRDQARALEILGVPRVPSNAEKKKAHEIVKDFVKRPLPKPFSYRPTANRADWAMYTQKLLPETWEILSTAGLAARSSHRIGIPVARPAGLSLLSILADCCAGETLARITDESAAYAVIMGLLAEKSHNDQKESTESLAAITLRMIDTHSIPIKRLIEFREREDSSAKGHDLRSLRHRYLDKLSAHAAALARLAMASDRNEVRRQFEQDMRDDLGELRTELRLAAREVLFSKEFLVAALGGAVTFGSRLVSVRLPDVGGATGGVVSIGGLFAVWNKFAKSRRGVLRNHPMAYLYELKGGPRV